VVWGEGSGHQQPVSPPAASDFRVNEVGSPLDDLETRLFQVAFNESDVHVVTLHLGLARARRIPRDVVHDHEPGARLEGAPDCGEHRAVFSELVVRDHY
jgi:hypothetical protein